MKTIFRKFVAAIIFGLFFVAASSAQSNHRPKQPSEKPPEQNAGQTKRKSSEHKPLEIIEKQPPRVTIFEKCFRDYGAELVRNRLRVTFEATGKIGAVEIAADSGCAEFDEESVRVARLIKFKPSIKDGQPVTVTKQVMYEGGMR